MSDTEPTEYFWMITRQIPIGNGSQMVTSNGTTDVPPGTTRLDLYSKILRHVVEEVNPGQPLGCVVFFSLEPNQL